MIRKRLLIFLMIAALLAAAACEGSGSGNENKGKETPTEETEPIVVSVSGIAISKTSTTLGDGCSETLSVTVEPADASNQAISWTSSNSAVVSVENGVITANSAGETTVTVTTEDGAFSAACAVTVTPYRVTYNGNANSAGSAPVDTADYECGHNVTVKGNTAYMHKSGCIFKGWSLSPDGAGTVYKAGESMTIGTANVTLYAVWKQQRFFVATDGVHGFELWTSDGTAEGTFMVKDIKPGSNSGEPEDFAELNGKIIFFASDSSGLGIWISDGTANGTEVLASISGSSGYFSEILNGKVFFEADDGVHGKELWVSDGTKAGTKMVKDIQPATSSYELFGYGRKGAVLGNRFFFTAETADAGIELWSSDGTESGTTMVKDIQSGSGSSWVGIYGVCNNKLLFIANDGIHGYELWESDGSTSGTVLLKDLNGTNTSTDFGFELARICVNNKIYFAADDKTGSAGQELWVSDGTEAGTQIVKDIRSGANGSYPRQFVSMGNKILFSADDGTHGEELWISDGTETGTVFLKDINPGSVGCGTPPKFLVEGSHCFIRADDGVHGSELWVSDGTTLGTILLKDIYTGVSGSSPTYFMNINGKMLFMSNDGIHGYELWESDGTEAGTKLLKDINLGSDACLAVD